MSATAQVIDDFRGEWAALSNFAPIPVTIFSRLEGREVVYPTGEHAFNAAKTVDPAERAAVLAAPSPGEAKRVGCRVTLRPGWDEHIRYAWCGGRSRKGDAVNVSHQWDGPRGRWWQGEPDLYHGDCSSIASAHRACVCESPITDQDGYGWCAVCSKYRGYGKTEQVLARMRELAAIPAGARRRDEAP